jgi:hypothetical protein
MDAARVAAFVDNPEALAVYENSVVVPRSQGKLGAQLQGDTGPYDYLLITSDALLPSFSGLVARKQSAGLRVKTETVANIYADTTNTGRDNPEKIRFYIRSAYKNWSTQYVLLGGDVSVVPYRGAYGYVSSSYTTKDLPCDLYYSCLDGSWNRDNDDAWGEPKDGDNGKEVDLLGEVYMGRAPVDTAAEVTTFVNKVVTYEESGTPNAKNALFAGEYLGDTAQGGAALDTLLPYFSGWTVEWLDDRPTLGAVWTKAQCIAKLNQSPHVVAHVGHGNETYALRMSPADVDSLTNANLFLVNSTACDCGAFDYSDCIGEDFSKRNSRGAFGVIMNSRYGWYSATQPWMFSGEFQQTFFDRLLSKGVRNIGRALQLSKHDMVGEVETRGSMTYRWCYFEITLLGDPHTELKTVSTRTLNVKSFDATPAVNDYFSGVPIVLDPPTPQGATRTTEFTTPYATGTQVVLAAPAAHEDLQFLRWRLDGVDQPEGQLVLSLTLSGDRQAVAVYRWQSLVIDMQALKAGTSELNPTGPAPRSLTILSIAAPGDPVTTQIAMTIGEGHWLRFSTDTNNNVDVYATGAEAEWRTAAEWAGKRIRGLTPNTTYTFQGKTRDGPGGQESELSDAGTYSTNVDRDVDRSGTVTEADLIFVRDAVLSGAELGQAGKAWATDVNDTRTTTVLDLILIRNRILGIP